MLADHIRHVALDLHRGAIVVAVGRGRGVRRGTGVCPDREHGGGIGSPGAQARQGRGELRLCYKAGACGYGIQCQLSARGHECVVVSRSLIPKRAGDRAKIDRRDPASVERLHRAGELTTGWAPDARHEAMRDLV